MKNIVNIGLLLLLCMSGIRAMDNSQANSISGTTPLHRACHPKDVEALVKAGARLEAKDNLGNTPLHIACRLGKTKIVEVLLKAGADPQVKGLHGNTPLHTACFNGRINTAKALLTAGVCLEAKNDRGNTPLHTACIKGRINTAKALLTAGANPQAENDQGDTPLHKACISGMINTVEVLLTAGANYQAKNEDGDTPLFSASNLGRTDIAKLLIEAGARMTRAQYAQRTPDQQKTLYRVWGISRTNKYMNELLFAQKCALNSAKTSLYPDRKWKGAVFTPTGRQVITKKEEKEIAESIPHNTLLGVPKEILHKISQYAAGQEFQEWLDSIFSDPFNDDSAAGPSSS